MQRAKGAAEDTDSGRHFRHKLSAGGYCAGLAEVTITSTRKKENTSGVAVGSPNSYGVSMYATCWIRLTTSNIARKGAEHSHYSVQSRSSGWYEMFSLLDIFWFACLDSASSRTCPRRLISSSPASSSAAIRSTRT